ncbi:hypothetical protein V7024_02225 [Bacillus sp. JJ864]|uniref:hypothetical protein n=1 Tax=Bacillus sp. JJ864 TaxID=3122975 RepID=UPI002FFF18D6
MEIQTEQKKSKKAEPKKNKKVPLKADKINLIVYTIGGGIVGSALFAATTYGAQTVTNISTLIGGLGGGVISGLLTLRGVRHTIELQKGKELEDSKPEKIRSIHLMIRLTEEYRSRISMLNGVVNSISEYGNTERLNGMLEYLDENGIGNNFDKFRDKMIEESLKVNGDIYFSVKEELENVSFHDVLLNSYILTGKFHPKEDLQENIIECIKEIFAVVNKIENVLEQELTKYEESLFSHQSDVNSR